MRARRAVVGKTRSCLRLVEGTDKRRRRLLASGPAEGSVDAVVVPPTVMVETRLLFPPPPPCSRFVISASFTEVAFGSMYVRPLLMPPSPLPLSFSLPSSSPSPQLPSSLQAWGARVDTSTCQAH